MPAENVLSSPCVAFALRRESMYFRRAYRFQQRFSGAPCCAQFRRPRRSSPDARAAVLMLETGIGAAAMEASLRWCLSGPCFGNVPYRPRFLLCVGFSGALQPQQRVGDLVVASEVVDQYGNHWPAILPNVWAGRGITAGRLLTMPELVSDPQDKQRLGGRFGALAVDMESAVVARLCHQQRVPFACLRVISDDWQTALSPHLVELLRQERVSLPRLAGHLLRRPKLIGEIFRLAGQTRRASQRLLGPLTVLIRDGLRLGVGG
jgi:adenosylhomocysteine nucleosidase